VLEQGVLGSGTTKGGLGGIRHQFVDELDVRLSQIATEFWREFDAFTSSGHDFEGIGYLFIAESVEGMGALRTSMPLEELVWSFRRDEPPSKEWEAQTAESKELSKRLRAAGFRFVGPTTVYAAMQAIGVVNDHGADCLVRADVERERTAL